MFRRRRTLKHKTYAWRTRACRTTFVDMLRAEAYRRVGSVDEAVMAVLFSQ